MRYCPNDGGRARLECACGLGQRAAVQVAAGTPQLESCQTSCAGVIRSTRAKRCEVGRIVRARWHPDAATTRERRRAHTCFPGRVACCRETILPNEHSKESDTSVAFWLVEGPFRRRHYRDTYGLTDWPYWVPKRHGRGSNDLDPPLCSRGEEVPEDTCPPVSDAAGGGGGPPTAHVRTHGIGVRTDNFPQAPGAIDMKPSARVQNQPECAATTVRFDRGRARGAGREHRHVGSRVGTPRSSIGYGGSVASSIGVAPPASFLSAPLPERGTSARF